MSTVHYSQGGLKYHADPACRRLQGGLDLWDWDGDAWAFTGYAVHPHTVEQAVSDGKFPCLACVPTDTHVLPVSGETFGHEPFEYDGVDICARCYTQGSVEWLDAHDNPRRRITREPVPWPCTSAIVLGLVPREPAVP